MLADPKINLRVNKNTPVSRYERCTRLTRQGLGFPQYSNDDVVIPALERWGYATEDARNYTVAGLLGIYRAAPAVRISPI